MWFNLDALGIALSLVTWALLAFTDWVIIRYVIVAWFWTNRPRFDLVPLTDFGLGLLALYQLFIGLSWFSHFRAMTTNPGTIRESSAPENFPNPRVCKLCKGYWKPPRAHHCKTCQRCIFRMDHHCPWINNCVGLGNQKLFMLFLGYTAFSAVLTLLFLVASAATWVWSQKSWSDAAPPGSVSLICSGVVAVECIAAVLFVCDFLQEQIENIEMNSTLVETYQRTHGPRSHFWDHFRVVFGLWRWQWPLPFVTCPPPDYTEEAIPDDRIEFFEDPRLKSVAEGYNEDHGLGIAGHESEEVASKAKDAADVTMSQGTRQRHRYDTKDASEND